MPNRLWLVFFGALFISLKLNAFSCVMTIAKDNCWSNYDVTITVLDLDTHKNITSIVIPKGKTWTKQQFTCQPHQKLMYYATFLPIIWKDDAGKTYRGHSFWALPHSINPGETAWQLNVCYARDFAETPLPVDSRGNCRCDFSQIPTGN